MSKNIETYKDNEKWLLVESNKTWKQQSVVKKQIRRALFNHLIGKVEI